MVEGMAGGRLYEREEEKNRGRAQKRGLDEIEG